MCRWGVSHPKWHFYVSGPKKYMFSLLRLPRQNISHFCTGSTRPCLDWQLSRFLTSQPINKPFKFDLKWRPNCKIWLKSQFAKEPSTVEIFEMYPWDALMCPLQITNDIEHLSLTLHGVNGMFIHHPSNVENYSNGHKSEMGQPNQKKKNTCPELERLSYTETFLYRDE